MSDKSNGRSFVFYETYLNSIEELEDEKLKLEVFRLISHYGIKGEIINDVSKISKSIFKAHQYNIDKSLERRKIAIENGLKGGAPIGNYNAKKNKTTENNQNQANNKQSKEQNNLNVNANVNANSNANIDVNLNEDVYSNAYEKENEDVYENRINKGRNIDKKLLNDNKALQKIATKTNQDINQIIKEFEFLINNQYIIDNNSGETIKTIDEYINYKKGNSL